jgi:Fe-S cluster biogenesis protein NfuA
MDNREFQAHTQEIDALVQRAMALPDEHARTTALDLVQAMMNLHGAVMSRIVDVLSESGDAGRTSLAKLGSDPLVCGMFVLYGIHPVTLEERVTHAIERLRPQLRKQGTSVELLGVADDVVRVKIQSDAKAHAPHTLKSAVEQAILEAAPEIAEIITEGLPISGFVSVDMIQPATKEDIRKEEIRYEESTA